MYGLRRALSRKRRMCATTVVLLLLTMAKVRDQGESARCHRHAAAAVHTEARGALLQPCNTHRCIHTSMGMAATTPMVWIACLQQRSADRSPRCCSYPRSRPAAAAAVHAPVCQPAPASPPRSVVAQRPATQSRACLRSLLQLYRCGQRAPYH